VINKKRNSNNYRITRHCNKLNANVIGGFSMLINYFKEHYKPEQLSVLLDRTFPIEKLYTNNNFKFYKKTNPKYYYIINGVKVNETHQDDIIENKIYKIYNSGYFEYIYK
jgi:hypothetical protein